MSDIDKAWDSLPPQDDIGGLTWDQTAEAAALRALFGTSAFRLLGNSGIVGWSDRDIMVAHAIQSHIVSCYLFAIEASKSKPKPDGDR